MADFVSVGILNTTSTGWYAKVFYEVTVSVRSLVCKLWEVKEDLRLALESLPADISSNVQLHLGELESDIRTICANQHLCPDGFVCHVTSQLTCVSLCDVMKCGDHGHCAVDQTFQPVCICEEDGTFTQFGEDCDLRPDKATLTQTWRPAGIAGLTISGLFLLAIVVAASLYLWKRWNGRKVSQRVSPERPVTHPDSLGHNSAPENHLKLASGAV
ncbi:uncharacterized protein LOC135465796 [Liolophura sinensis]|uniref:uncharacterized protein LOC135465796 n=1 Tax=Liolophura sinensis TaxID=3198878 RepID=UPI0031584129